MWSKRWYLKRNISCDVHLLNEFLETDVGDYINSLRMNEETFNMSLTKVSAYIQRKNTRLRWATSPKRRLIATVRYLATGRSFEEVVSLFYSFWKVECLEMMPSWCRQVI